MNFADEKNVESEDIIILPSEPTEPIFFSRPKYGNVSEKNVEPENEVADSGFNYLLDDLERGRLLFREHTK
jgi:hypothetical protein